MMEKYWDDYSEFIAKVEKLTKLSPNSLLELYAEFVESLETGLIDDYALSELAKDNDFNFRWLIQKVIDHPELSTNEIKQDFQDKIIELDKRMEMYLLPGSLEEKDWYRSIKLDPDKFK
jgi:hypothetical protein